MAKIIFDASIIIKYKLEAIANNYLSAVVLQKIVAGASDKTEISLWQATRKFYERNNRLLVPTGEDWLEAGRILNALLRGLKSKNKGRTPRLPPEDKHRIVRDVLIARTAKRESATIVTDNIQDFKAIQRFCACKFISGEEYFGGLS